jgi:glycosyltransferase involved in cell wall biosynthesis
MKIVFVVQRCGLDVFGGAEALTLQIGLNLSEFFETEILTTRAKEATTWKDHYPEGIEKIDKLTIRRFSVDKERDPKFVSLSQYLEIHNDDIEKGTEFMNASGPVCNDLLDFIKTNKNDYDLFIFVGYLYWLTFNGMSLVKEKSILLSTAHDEPWIYFKIFEKIFEMPRGYLFLTNAEKEFVHKKFNHLEKPFQIVGHGMNLSIASKDYKSSKIKLPENYILYIGRISAGKGCQKLSDFFNRYLATHNTNLKLVMLGSLEHRIENNNAIVFQNISDYKKFHVLKNCKVFIMPSQFESLNIACLEAWLFKKPVLVNGDSSVLFEHCKNSQGGLYFHNYEEFSEFLDLILQNELLAKKLGINGEKYVRENYNWGITVKKYQILFDKVMTQIKTH